jgi:AraC-like DNA-binding protein
MAEHTIELVRRRPHVRLRGLVAGVAGIRERTSGLVTRRQPAGSLLPLVLSFGNPLEVAALSAGEGAGRTYGSFLAGLMPGYASTSFEHSQDCVQVYLTPLGAYRMLGVPGSRFACRVTAADDIDGMGPMLGVELPERLEGAGSWRERFAMVEDVLLRLARGGRDTDDFVTWMWRQISASGGRARIGDLIEQTGWSHRHVTARFRNQIGLTPKAAAAVVRFERANAELGTTPLAELAMRHGYADQSHLTREVARYAGEPPIELTRAQRPTAHTALGLHPAEVP